MLSDTEKYGELASLLYSLENDGEDPGEVLADLIRLLQEEILESS